MNYPIIYIQQLVLLRLEVMDPLLEKLLHKHHIQSAKLKSETCLHQKSWQKEGYAFAVTHHEAAQNSRVETER